MKQVSSLKPHDVALALKLITKGKSDWKQMEIAAELGISQGAIAKSLSRLRVSGLISGKRINRSALIEFLIHGLKYVFPADIGALAVGVPTGISSPFFEDEIVQGDDDAYVWASSEGNYRGQAVMPFYPKQAEAVLKDEVFYELLSLVEILRSGRARERKIAEKIFRSRVKSL